MARTRKSQSKSNRYELIRYKNKSGRSGVSAYFTTPGADFIVVLFEKEDHQAYVYNYAHSGRAHIETMKQLAQNGMDLSGYISRHRAEIWNNYAKTVPVTADQSIEI